MGARATVILFDVDGTLVTCGGAGRRAMQTAFRELFGSDDVFEFTFGGATDRAIARRALVNGGIDPSDETIDAFLGRYLEHLPAMLAASERFAVLPGVCALLDRLEPLSHLSIGLGTGNVEAGARVKLRRGGLDTRFAFGGFGCDHEERARLLESGAARGAARLGLSVDRCRVVVVGDTLRDVEAARAIGADCVAVATGTSPLTELEQSGAMLVCASLTSPAAFERIAFD